MNNPEGGKITFKEAAGGFVVAEDRHLESTINVANQNEALKQFVGKIKAEVEQMVKLRDAIVKDIDQYNWWVDLMKSAVEECQMGKNDKKLIEKLVKIEDGVIKIEISMDKEKMPATQNQEKSSK